MTTTQPSADHDTVHKTPRQPSTMLFVALVSITFVGPLSIHIFLPAVPFVRQAFSVDAGTAQLSFSLSMLSMAVSTLFYGSLSDRFGRLPALVVGLLLFSGGAAIAAIAPSITVLILARILQGVGAACGVVVARTIVHDVYGADRLGQMIAYLTAAYVVGPLISPAFGGLLTDQFGWQSSLIVPAIFGFVAIVISVTIIGETSPGRSTTGTGLMRGYGRLLSVPKFALFALNPAVGSGAFFAINAGATYLMVDVLERPAAEYGLYFMLGPLGYMTGNYLSGRLSGRVSADFLIVFGSSVSVAGALLLIGMILGFGLSPIGLFLPSCLMSLGQGLSNPQAQARAMAVEPSLTGTASGIVMFLQFLFSAGLAQLVAMLFDGTAVPLMIVVTIACVTSFILGLAAVSLDRRNPA